MRQFLSPSGVCELFFFVFFAIAKKNKKKKTAVAILMEGGESWFGCSVS